VAKRNGFKNSVRFFIIKPPSLLIENKNEGGNFELNPFNSSQENVLGLSSSFRNSLFYNRGKQKQSLTLFKK
jgi:hypothetical protein